MHSPKLRQSVTRRVQRVEHLVVQRRVHLLDARNVVELQGILAGRLDDQGAGAQHPVEQAVLELTLLIRASGMSMPLRSSARAGT